MAVKGFENFIGVGGDGSEIAILGAGIDIDDGLLVVVVHGRGPRRRRHLDQVSHQLRPLLRDDGNFHQVLQIGHPVLRRLHGDLIGHPIARVQPEIGSGLKAAAQGNQRTLGDFARGQADLRNPRALDIHVQRGQRKLLLHVNVGRAGNVPHAVRDTLRNGVVALHVGADDLHVDGSGQSEIQDLGDDIRRLEEEFDAGKALRQIVPANSCVSSAVGG